MPIKGSFAAAAEKHLAAVDGMCRATAEESLDKIKDRVQDNTPVDTGELRESVTESKVRATGSTYRGDVSSDVEYAQWVEYGTAPHTILPRDKQALSFNGVARARVEHPGTRGSHMFRRGGLEFEQMDAARIARENAAKFLGSV